MNRSPKNKQASVINPQGTNDEMLHLLQCETFEYFLKEMNPHTGLIADKTEPGAAASIAAAGMGLSSYIVAAERGFMTREEAINRTHILLKFFYSSHQGPEADATGYKGFYYHFLDMETGKRAWESELSTIDTAILMAGVLTVRNYFTGNEKKEIEIRELADELYARVDWQWALNGADTLTHGWIPDNGFLPYRWDDNYSEAHIMYILAMGSPNFSIGNEGYKKWTSTFKWHKIYDIEHIYAGPLFIHQMSHMWLDFKGIMDDMNKKVGIDYFENSARATRMQQKYAIDNPKGFAHYGENGWGFTASDGPGPCVEMVNGVEREFFNYTARGVPFGPDDGTISPWAVVASLPFTPELVLKTVRHAIEQLDLKKYSDYGFDASYNPTYLGGTKKDTGWISPWQYGLNQGPIVLMIENFRSGLIWETMKKCPYIIDGYRMAGFTGGWLDKQV